MIHGDIKRAQQRTAPKAEPAWLLLVHQLPTRPSNVRVKTWRRLQKLGALAVKNSVYVLPNTPQAREDFEWMKTEISGMKGRADVFVADSVDWMSADELVADFRKARQRDYDALRAAVERLLRHRTGRTLEGSERQHLERSARALRERWIQIEAIDFFKADGREETFEAFKRLERLVQGGDPSVTTVRAKQPLLRVQDFQNRLWVTRPHPGVDRMACGWLIRRFIDPQARFGFAGRPEERPNAVPFDMFGVEFSHQGSACSFETLVRRFGIALPAIEPIAQMVHDLDLKDEKYSVPEAAAVGRLIEGLQLAYQDDQDLLERGIVLFEALYRSFCDSAARKGSPREGTRRKRPGRR